MKNILSSFFVFAVLSIAVAVGPSLTHAQFQTQGVGGAAVSFPAGCASGLGYSVTNGQPCNGTGTATTNVAGCSTALGYSTLNGAPCSGGSVAINYLSGCTSVYGHSSVNGAACNGTAVASVVPGTSTPIPNPSTPGLPTTGAGGIAFANIMLLLSSAALAAAGAIYFKKYYPAN